MQLLFIVVAVATGLFFLLKRRPFDYFSLAYFSAVVYFLPGFFGVTSFHTEGDWSENPIHPEAYAIMIAVLISIACAAWLAPAAPAGPKGGRPDSMDEWVVNVLLAIACVGLAGMLATSGRGLFSEDKSEVLAGLGRWYILFYTAATLGLPIATFSRRYVVAAVFLAMLLFDLFIGFRSALSIAVLATLTLLLHRRGPRRLIVANWKVYLAGAAFGFAMFGYKEIAFAVKAGMWDQVVAALSMPESYLWAITHSEPFLVQQTLNEVVTHRFETSPAHIYSAIYQLILFAPEMGAQGVSFNSVFQPVLFPEIDYGIASSIWAQMWSAGGWPLLVVFLIFFNLVLAAGNATLRIHSIGVRTGLAPVFAYWAFYIHRNDLAYALALEKRHLLMLLVVVLLVRLLYAATARRPLGTDRVSAGTTSAPDTSAGSHLGGEVERV